MPPAVIGNAVVLTISTKLGLGGAVAGERS
jgi:hypothetical protein